MTMTGAFELTFDAAGGRDPPAGRLGGGGADRARGAEFVYSLPLSLFFCVDGNGDEVFPVVPALFDEGDPGARRLGGRGARGAGFCWCCGFLSLGDSGRAGPVGSEGLSVGGGPWA